MQITVHLGLDKLPESVRKQLERAGIVNVGGTVMVNSRDPNGDEITTIYSDPSVELPNQQQAAAPSSLATNGNHAPSIKGLQEQRLVINKETIWIKEEHEAIKIEQNAFEKLKPNDPDFKRRKEALRIRRQEISRRGMAQGKRRQALKEAEAKAKNVEDAKRHKKDRKKAARKLSQSQSSSMGSDAPVKPVVQLPLPPNYEPVVQKPLLSQYNPFWNPTLHGPKPVNAPVAHDMMSSSTMPLFRYHSAQPSFQAPKYQYPAVSTGPAMSAYPPLPAASPLFNFSSPPRFFRSQPPWQQPVIHPDRLSNFGQSSRELQETVTFPPTPSFMEALGHKRTGANMEPVAKRRSSPAKFQVALSILHGFSHDDSALQGRIEQRSSPVKFRPSPSFLQGITQEDFAPLQKKTPHMQLTTPKKGQAFKIEIKQEARENVPFKKEAEEEPVLIKSEILTYEDRAALTEKVIEPATENIETPVFDDRPTVVETMIEQANGPVVVPTCEPSWMIGTAEVDKQYTEISPSAVHLSLPEEIFEVKEIERPCDAVDDAIQEMYEVRELPAEPHPEIEQ